MLPKRILIVGPSWVGDMVMAQSLLITLKQNSPDSLIDVLAPFWSFGLLERMPEINRAIAMPLTHGQFGLGARFRLGQQLRSEKYQQAIILPNSWKSALIPWFAGIPLRTGYVGECRWGLLNDSRHLDKQQLKMTVERFVSLGLTSSTKLPPTCPTPQLTITTEAQQSAMAQFKLTESSKILALCPGAEYGEAKRWPVKHFATLANHQLNNNWQVWLFGSDKDQAIAAQINQLTQNRCTDLTGRTSLSQAIDLLSLAQVVVSNDSGLMHVAAALDKPVIALYGSSDPSFTPPLNDKAHIVTQSLACSPCFQRVCPLGHTDCLYGISPEQVQSLLPS